MAGTAFKANPFVALGQLRPELMGVTFHIAWIFLLMYHSPIDAQIFIPGTSVTVFYAVSFAALAVPSVVFAAVPKKFLDFFYCRSGVLAAGLVTVFGTALYCASQITANFAIIIAAGVFTGVGSCAIAALWATAFARMTPGQTCANLPFLLFLTTVAIVDICFIPVQLYYVAVISLAVLDMAFLLYSVKSLGKGNLEVTLKPGAAESSIITPGRAFSILIAIIAVLGTLEGMLATLTSSSNDFFGDLETLSYFIENIVIFIALGAFIKETRPEGLLALFSLPILGIVMFLVPVICTDATMANETFYNIGLVSQELVLIAGTVALAISFKMPPIRTFLVARVMFGATDLLGNFLGDYVLGDALSSAGSIMVFILCELVVVLMVFIFFMLHRFNATHNDIAGKQNTNAGNFQIRDACERIADACKLSPRERDVFFLLAEGRSTARVKEELCIAEGTVNTHVRNIYGKLGVHTRQELLDMVYGNNAH